MLLNIKEANPSIAAVVAALDWLVPEASYMLLRSALRAGVDDIVRHYAAKSIENVSPSVSRQAHEDAEPWRAHQCRSPS